MNKMERNDIILISKFLQRHLKAGVPIKKSIKVKWKYHAHGKVGSGVPPKPDISYKFLQSNNRWMVMRCWNAWTNTIPQSIWCAPTTFNGGQLLINIFIIYAARHERLSFKRAGKHALKMYGNLEMLMSPPIPVSQILKWLHYCHWNPYGYTTSWHC